MKFGHVTFFWNGNRSGYFDETKEEYIEIPSDSGITFNEQPKMKALEIAEKTRDAILSGKFDQVNDFEITVDGLFVCLHEVTKHKYLCRYVLTFQMEIWWVTQVTLKPQSLLARLLMKPSR